jgi:hypothetical protein
MRLVTDASSISPCKKRTSNTSTGYLGQASIRREQWDMIAEDWKMEPQKATSARQWHGKHMSVAAVVMHTTMRELFEMVFSIWSVPRLCSVDGQSSHFFCNLILFAICRFMYGFCSIFVTA